MKNRIKIFLIALPLLSLIGLNSKAQNSYSTSKPAYIIYNSYGQKVSYSQMLSSIATADISLFGELHNDVISHWLELQLVKDLYTIKGKGLVVGAEMFEADNQLVMGELLEGKWFDMKAYEENSVLWNNYSSDYKPILEYAYKNQIPFVATNVPRRYARMVSKRGIEVLDSLSDRAKSYIAPLPIATDLSDKFYVAIAEVFKETMPMPMSSVEMANIVKAQMVKDATMAHFIVNNLPKGGHLFHFHGELHSAFHSGIGHY
ncbi:MAG: ChaN family lipoprotein [Bacteroidales bacterium]